MVADDELLSSRLSISIWEMKTGKTNGEAWTLLANILPNLLTTIPEASFQNLSMLTLLTNRLQNLLTIPEASLQDLS